MLSRSEMKEIWSGAKYVARQDPEGLSMGLAKIAMAVWAEACDAGLNPGITKEAREGFFASFACAAVTENAFDQDASLTKESHAVLNDLTAESAVYDLGQLVKTAGPADWMKSLKSLPIIDTLKQISRTPQARGAAIGAGIGAGVGAYRDDENRLRGAAMYALPGAAIGGLIGHGVHEHRQGQASAAADALKQQGAQKGRGALAVDVLRKYYNYDPSMLQHLRIQEKDLASHFEQHNHVPESLLNFIHPEDHVELHKALSQALGGHSKKSFFAQGGGMPPQQPSPDQMAQDPSQGAPPEMQGQAPGGQPSAETLADPNEMGQIGDQGLSQDIDKGHRVVDNMIYLANQVSLPQLGQEMDANRDELAVHFAEGNAYVPASLQHHFQMSEHAKAFMDKYKQRFGAVG